MNLDDRVTLTTKGVFGGIILKHYDEIPWNIMEAMSEEMAKFVEENFEEKKATV